MSSVSVKFIVACIVMAATVGGCSNRAQLFEGNEGWFSKPVDFFAKPEWAQSANHGVITLGPTGSVAPEDLVNADGSCASKATEASATEASPQPAALSANAPGSSDNKGSTPPAPAGTETSPVLGGMALGMSECETVRRAGSPSQVMVSSEEGERKVVLTYAGGSWPGIYTFNAGRLKVVDAVPQLEKPKAMGKTKKKPQATRNVAQQGSNAAVVR